MPVEQTTPNAIPKPWGMRDIRPWSGQALDGETIGEIVFERESESVANSSLCLKLLFAAEPLSIQVHPDDQYAKTMGLTGGKSEAWYVVAAEPGARIGIGLTQHLNRSQLRRAIADGSIRDLLLWRSASAGESYYIPAGTVHAIGAGLVIAEIQQRIDATFRLYDYGRGRELHLDRGMAVARAEPVRGLVEQCRLSGARRLLAAGAGFVFERLDLPPASNWLLDTSNETWLLALSGAAAAGNLRLATGDAVFAADGTVHLRAGPKGLVALVGYARTEPYCHLLRTYSENGRDLEDDPNEDQVMACYAGAMRAFMRQRRELAS